MEMERSFWEQQIESEPKKNQMMVNGDIKKDGYLKSKVDPCAVCSLRIKANSVLFSQCDKKTNSK